MFLVFRGIQAPGGYRSIFHWPSTASKVIMFAMVYRFAHVLTVGSKNKLWVALAEMATQNLTPDGVQKPDMFY
jgi:hypothetical protein